MYDADEKQMYFDVKKKRNRPAAFLVSIQQHRKSIKSISSDLKMKAKIIFYTFNVLNFTFTFLFFCFLNCMWKWERNNESNTDSREGLNALISLYYSKNGCIQNSSEHIGIYPLGLNPKMHFLIKICEIRLYFSCFRTIL